MGELRGLVFCIKSLLELRIKSRLIAGQQNKHESDVCRVRSYAVS